MLPPSSDRPAEQSVQRKLDLSPLDGLRGIASLVIVVGHFFTFWSPKVDSDDPFPTFAPEYLSAVTLFFVISGFTLVQVYDKASEDRFSEAPLQTSEEKRLFFRKRVARLLPLYGLGLIVGIAPLIAYYDVGIVIANIFIDLLGIQSLIVVVGNQWNGPLWTVSAFVFCYLFFPWAVRRYRNMGYDALRKQVIHITIFSTLLCAAFTAIIPGALILIHILAPVRFMHFVVGVCAGYMAKRWNPATKPTIVAEVHTAIYAILMAISIVIGATTESIGAWMGYSYNIEFALPYFQATWLIALTSADCGGWTKAFLSSKPLRFLGDISYAVYCLHFPIFNWCAWAVANDGISEDAVPLRERDDDEEMEANFYFDPWAIVPILAIILVISTAAHKILEAPARAAISKTSQQTHIPMDK
eukprot:TRINITY_DN12271_c0_g1_i1.p1 TRINITY_DN12271_c0_g1~~TRINITY_DN12271_c0_g1_i1.p1  ORF type:complete len:414 (+),score=91.64 TRINITY_DN12271_c0_g1_i1:67-1308(+)